MYFFDSFVASMMVPNSHGSFPLQDETAFEIAEALCDEMIIKIFKEGTSLASLSFNSFVIACIEGDLQIMKGMLEKGFNPNIPIDVRKA